MDNIEICNKIKNQSHFDTLASLFSHPFRATPYSQCWFPPRYPNVKKIHQKNAENIFCSIGKQLCYMRAMKNTDPLILYFLSSEEITDHSFFSFAYFSLSVFYVQII